MSILVEKKGKEKELQKSPAMANVVVIRGVARVEHNHGLKLGPFKARK